MNEAHIEKAATDLLMQIYRDRRFLWQIKIFRR